MLRVKTAALVLLVLVLPAVIGWLPQLHGAAGAQEPPYTLGATRQYQVQYTHTLVNTSADVIARQDVWIPIPMGNLNQRVLDVTFNPQPAEFRVDNWGQQVARYVVTNMAGGSTLEIGWTADIQLSDLSFNIDPAVSLDDIPPEIITTYTADDEMYLITDPVVVAAAAAAVSGETTLYGKVESIFQYVIDHMSYSMEGGRDAAPTVLARGNGSCSEYAHATMALLRANGIPCRILGGTRNRSVPYGNYTDTDFHRATEVYLPGYGWVPFDTGLGDTRGRPMFTRYNDYLVFHTAGGRSSLLHSYYTCRLNVADTTIVIRLAQWTVSAITPDRPPAVTTNDAVDVASSSATLNGNLTAMGTAASVAVSFEYGTAPGVYSGETPPELKTAAWAFSFTLDGLSPGAAYYYRAKAVGADTVYGAEKSFTTGTTPPGVATKRASGITTNAARLNGDLTSLGTWDSAVVSFVWGTTSGLYPNETAAQTMTGMGAFYCDLDGLALGTTYYYKARAVGQGTGYGVEKSFSTATIAPEVTTGHVTSITTTSARLSGDLISMGTGDNATVSFVWGTVPGAYPNETAAQTMTGTGAFYFDVDNLTPATTYYYKARAVGHQTSYGVRRSFASAGVPPAVTTGDAGGITASSARLTGDLTSLGTDGSATVSFVWGTRSGIYPNETASQAMSGMGAFYSDLDKISPGTTCYYRAKAVGSGDPVYGAEKSFITLSVPRVQSLHPYNGKPGQHLTVTISGSDLDGATFVDFGPRIAVEDFAVDSSTEITVKIAIDAGAAEGARDVSVVTPLGTATLTDAFTVKESSAGGVPAWIWPLVGVAVVAAGVGGFFLFRGGELSLAGLRPD